MYLEWEGSSDRFVSLYGTTPPRASSTPEEISRAAERLAVRLRGLKIDGIVVYDVQEETGRTAASRTFPYLPTIDPRAYSLRLRELTGKRTITYKCIAEMCSEAWEPWLTETQLDFGIDHLSLVGRPSSHESSSALSLSTATQLAASHPAHFALGGVVIAERHKNGRNESHRMLHKVANGCSFFISQAIYEPKMTVQLLTDYVRDCTEAEAAPRPITLTFVPCGRARTLEFMQWLGIAISEEMAMTILSDAAPLDKSIAICCENLRTILGQDYVEKIPLGLNVESVSNYRDEIDASVDLHHALTEVFREFGLRH